MISLTCPYCRHEWSVAEPLGGSSVWCPQCGTPNDVPVPESPSVVDSATLENAFPGSREGVDFTELLGSPTDSSELGRLGGYRVLRAIGVGGMGIVFEAEDPILKRRIALKVMRPETGRSEIARKRFLREAEAAAQLKHDHILSIYQIGEDNGVLYLTMPLLQGETLDARLKREHRLPVAEVVAIGKQVALGLAAAHAKGLIHRDIKPGNIWLEAPQRRAIILDFGLARQTKLDASVTGSGVILGSPAFMAPEQAAGENVGPSADLFSLGCVLYVCATGQRPFPGKEVMAVLMALANHTPRSPRQCRLEIPEAVSNLVMKLLEKSPNDRPESADEVIKVLDAIEAHTQIGTASFDLDNGSLETKKTVVRASPSTVEQVSPKRTRRRMAGTLVIVLGIAAASVWLASPHSDKVGTYTQGPIDDTKSEVSVNQDVWNREVAERVLDAGGMIRYRLSGQASPIEVSEVRRLPDAPFRIQMITFEKIQKADVLLGQLHDLEKLECLIVKHCAVNDSALIGLRNLPEFEWLMLKNTEVTGTGFGVLSNLSKLRYLDIVDAPVTDKGLSHFDELPNLDRLFLQGTKVSGVGLQYLSRMPNLRRLALNRSALDDNGISHLPSLPNLTDLSLEATSISDVGLLRMKPQSVLNHLNLIDTRVTQQGVEAFRSRWGGNCEIVFGPKTKTK